MSLKLLKLFFRTVRTVPATRPATRLRVKRQRILTNDSDPRLLTIWRQVRADFFPDRSDLDEVVITWSNRRQKRVLASVSIRQKRVRVAKELYEDEYEKWLTPLLYHEMCHAVLGESVPIKNNKRQWHGSAFKSLEQQHPLMHEFEAWIKSGGWVTAVRRSRSKQMWVKRKQL